MYQAKHLKTGKEVPKRANTNFRMWKSGKKWLYASSVLLLIGESIGPAFLPSMQGNRTVQAATATTGSLVPGTPVRTPDVVPYYTGLLTASGTSAFTASGNTTIKTTGDNTSANWNSGTLTLQNSGGTLGIGAKEGNSWATFNPTLNMQQPVSFSGSIKSVPNVITNAANQVGQYLGMYFVPVGTSFSNTSLSGGKTTTAITGVPNSVFLGRNYWYNGNASNTIQVSQTDASTTQTDVGTVDNFAVSSSGESFSVTWTPTSVGATATTGTITLSVNNGTTTQTVTGTVTMQNAMQVGFGGGTGNYGSAMTVYNVKQTNSGFDGFSAYQPTGQVNVNYLNTKTNASMAPKGSAWASTAITGNLGDTIGILAPGGAVDSATYDYTVSSAPSGYTFSAVSGSPATVAASNAIVNAYYTPNSQSATFNYSLAPANTTSAAWGATSSVAPSVTSGYTDGAISAPSVTSAAAGYTTSYVYNGASYSTLTSAESAYASQYSAVAGTFAGASMNPTFTLVASANSQTMTTTTAWTASNTPGASSAAATGSVQASLATAYQYASLGNPVTTGIILNATGYWQSMGVGASSIPTGYNIATISYNGYTLSQAYGSSGAASMMYLMSGTSVLASSAGANLAAYARAALLSAVPAMVSAFTVPASSTTMAFTYAANSTAQGEIYLKSLASSGAALNSGMTSAGTSYSYYAPNAAYNATSAPTSAGFSNTANTWRVTTGEYYNSYATWPTDASLAVKGYSYSVLLLTSAGGITTPTDAQWSSAAAAGASGSLLSGSAGSTTALSGYDFTTMASAASLATVAYSANSTGKVANFAVVYTAVAPTVTTKNTLITASAASNWARTDNIVSVTDTNGTSTSPSYIAGNMNTNVTGPNGYSSTSITSTPGIYTVTYTYTDPNNHAVTTATATVTVVGARGFTTNVALDQAITGSEANTQTGSNYSPNDVNVIADNTPFTSLASGAVVSGATVSSLSFTGDGTPNLTAGDISVDNTGKVTIPAGKLNLTGTYSFVVTYTYTNSVGQSVSVSATDTISVAAPFELPFAGGVGLIGILAFAGLTGAGGLALRKGRRDDEDVGRSDQSKGNRS